ncbi:hypothetical protein V9L05_19880 [Bernardetia sp. Wsw4-3y2]|uniref:hypothetical protein n=1 Tax=Bernardetia sp. Wsw4-3y2 TaxID=3127471 RepID=UPI0030CE43DC
MSKLYIPKHLGEQSEQVKKKTTIIKKVALCKKRIPITNKTINVGEQVFLVESELVIGNYISLKCRYDNEEFCIKGCLKDNGLFGLVDAMNQIEELFEFTDRNIFY